LPERIVSVRIPTSLILELRRGFAKDHYKDVSELVRTIVRKKFLQLPAPAAAGEFGALSKEQLIKELERIVERLRK
jgi:Arc/MetJ-type ribon-helix-helix transcriptional regulator